MNNQLQMGRTPSPMMSPMSGQVELTPSELKAQAKMKKKNAKERQKNGSEAIDLYKMQKKLKKPMSFNRMLLYILILLLLVHIGLFAGFFFTVDKFNFLDIYGNMFESFGLPNIINALFKQ